MYTSPGARMKEVGLFHGAVFLRRGMPFLPSEEGQGVAGSRAKAG